MNISYPTTNILADLAIKALKNAYQQCGDKAAKDSIETAYQAIVQVYRDLEQHGSHDGGSEHDSCCDPSEYCAAV